MPNLTRREALLGGVGALAGGLAAAPAAAAPRGDNLLRYESPKKYRITHRGEVTNGTVPLDSLELWLPVPQNDPGQSVGEVTTLPRVELVPDLTGTALVARRYAKTGLPTAGRTWSLEVSYEIVCRRPRANWPAIRRAAAAKYTENRQYELFTRPEKYIQTGQEEIAARAKQLRAKHRHPVDFARAAYEWVLGRTEYRMIEGLGGATYCLEHGHGECGDYCALWVALLRAAGIPARPVVGIWADRTNGWHVWAEFMLPGGVWLPVDPQIGDRTPWNRQYYFGSGDNRRVALCRTLDIELTGKRLGQMKADFLQTGCCWWHSRKLRPDARKPSVKFSVEGQEVKG